jgi:hypothetical protein
VQVRDLLDTHLDLADARRRKKLALTIRDKDWDAYVRVRAPPLPFIAF